MPLEINVRMKKDKETKGAIRYVEEGTDGKPPILQNLYIRKWALAGGIPENLLVSVKEDV